MTIGIGVVADDFTGGLMVASHIERGGYGCPYVTDPAALDELGDQVAVVIPTRLRFLPPHQAVRLLDQLTDALERTDTRQICYKYCATFDSTDEGNIGPCADLLMEKYRPRQLLFCPGFPVNRIFVHEGYMFFKDRLISESIKRLDPLTPMNDPDMVRVLQRQTRRKVGLLPHRILHQGAAAACAALDEQAAVGIAYVMVDSVDDDDVARAVEVGFEDRVVTGGDAFPIALALEHGRRGLGAVRRAPPPPVSGPGVALAGSCAPATLEQVDVFEGTHPVLRIALDQVASADAAVATVLAWALPKIGDGPVAITTAGGPEAVARAQARHGQRSAAELGEVILGRIARHLFEAGVRRFVVSGGETAGAVVTALEISRMQVAPFDELGAGRCVAREPGPTALFLKPGKIGAPDVFLAALARMAA